MQLASCAAIWAVCSCVIATVLPLIAVMCLIWGPRNKVWAFLLQAEKNPWVQQTCATLRERCRGHVAGTPAAVDRVAESSKWYLPRSINLMSITKFELATFRPSSHDYLSRYWQLCPIQYSELGGSVCIQIWWQMKKVKLLINQLNLAVDQVDR